MATFTAKDTATLKIAVELDDNGNIREDATQTAGKVRDKTFTGIASSLTGGGASAAYDALKSTLGYNAVYNTVKMSKDVTSVFSAE